MATPKRYSQWQATLPFALNNDFYTAGQGVQSQQFLLPTTEVTPMLVEFAPNGPDPSGWRHTLLHPSYVRVLASGQGATTVAFKALELQSTDISTGSGISKTRVFLFRTSKYNTPGKTRITGLRLWASNTSDFLTPQSIKILYKLSYPWQSGLALQTSQMLNHQYWMPTSYPEYQNLWRTDGGWTIHGSGDADVSQWIYMAIAASGTTPLGEYGGVSEIDKFNVRVSYDVDNMTNLFD